MRKHPSSVDNGRIPYVVDFEVEIREQRIHRRKYTNGTNDGEGKKRLKTVSRRWTRDTKTGRSGGEGRRSRGSVPRKSMDAYC